MPLVIRTAVAADAPVIAAFNQGLAQETEGKTLDPALIAAGVAALIADSTKGRYYVAEADGLVVGQLMHTFEWSDWRNGDVWWIQSVYVHPEHRGRGVYDALHRHLEAMARQTPGVVGLRLYVERENARAQRTYTRMGMQDAHYLVMEQMFDSK